MLEDMKNIEKNWQESEKGKIEDAGSVDPHEMGMLLEEYDGDEWMYPVI